MKKIMFLFLIAGMISCGKKEETLNINLTLNESGSLVVKLADSSGNAISNVAVKLNQNSGSYSSSTLDEKTTDAGGNLTFENILEGTYYLYIKKITVNSKVYTVSQSAQVVSGKTRTVDVNPQTYVGTITLTFTDNSNSPSVPIVGNTVYLFRADDYINLGGNPSFADIAAIKFAEGTTNASGRVGFNGVPSGISFYCMIFNSTKKYLPYSNFNLNKGDDYKSSITVNSYSWVNL